jgi:hypothetical protein
MPKSLDIKHPVTREQRQELQELEATLQQAESKRHEEVLRDLHYLRGAIAGYDFSERIKPSDAILTSIRHIKEKHATPKPKAD